MSFTLTDKHRVRIRETENFWLATVKADASAHLVPIWAVLVDDLFYMGTGPRSLKVRNILAHPRVALALPDTRSSVIFEGRATVLSGSPPTGVLERFAEKYDWSFQPDEEWILVQFVPQKVLSW